MRLYPPFAPAGRRADPLASGITGTLPDLPAHPESCPAPGHVGTFA